MKKVYAEATKEMGDEKEVHARHILVEKEDEAKAILADLKKGGDFAAIAKEKSKDPGSKENGGDLGYFTKDQMVPEFAEVAFKLDKGQLSDPVKTQFGWHVLKVEDKRNRPIPEFDKVKDQIEHVCRAQGAGRSRHQAAQRSQDREDSGQGRCGARCRAGSEAGRTEEIIRFT